MSISPAGLSGGEGVMSGEFEAGVFHMLRDELLTP